MMCVKTNNKWKMQLFETFKLVFIRYNFLITEWNQIIDQPDYLCIMYRFVIKMY